MWIAKPIEKLTPAELNQATDGFNKKANEQDPIPLSQRLIWQKAAQSAGAKIYLVYEPNENLGGWLHSFDGSHFECTNGPLLNWDEKNKIPSEFATFAHAVSRLSNQFKSMTLTPRWTDQFYLNRISFIPIQPTDVLQVTTIHILIEQTAALQFQKLSPRLKRTLSKAKQHNVQTRLKEVSTTDLRDFVSKITAFAAKRDFFTPPFGWFEALTQKNSGAEPIDFFLVEARIETPLGSAFSHLLVALTPQCAHYLFGFDQRTPGFSISTAGSAHFSVLEECIRRGILNYDLNGYTDPDADHPYSGVSRFKQQFMGKIIQYKCPQFCIS